MNALVEATSFWRDAEIELNRQGFNRQDEQSPSAGYEAAALHR
jgi:hypothetical protein